MCLQSLLSCFCSQKEINNLLASKENLQGDIKKDDYISYCYTKLGEFIFTDFGERGTVRNHNLRVVDNRKRYRKYRQALNNAVVNTDKSIKNILSTLYFRARNNNNRSEVENSSHIYLDNANPVGEDIIKYFIFFYTADQIYNNYFHEQIRRNKYNEMAEIVKLLRPYIAEQINTQRRNQLLRTSGNLIFKSFPNMSHPTIQDLKRMRAGTINYFPSFFLADVNEGKAKNTNSWITISIDPDIDHQFLAVRPPFCQSDSNKLIIFPFLCYQKEQDSKQRITNNLINLKFRQVHPQD